MRYYHGTSYESGQLILQYGFQNGIKVWNASCEDMLYMISEQYDNEDNYYQSFDELPAVRFAIEAAQIAAAHQNQLNKDLTLFEFIIPDEYDIEEDDSCDGMYDSYQIHVKELNDAISNGEIEMNVYHIHGGYEPYLRAFYLMNLCNNPYYTFTDDNLCNICQNIYLHESSWFYDDYLAAYDSYEKVA